ncbi:cell filamentation protein Fic [Ralstonia solanacearum]|uniref:Fic family protein n=1 Tax=Ralstonia pseudosolanacearum TaxID=1310165 RepID=UPI000E5935D4|nr:Fic family protein [Ralstonia pseudosolanacearum]AXW49497.1 cell filamentation protein Fic [Ralstonia solanacearum]
MSSNSTWIWQRAEWPDFTYDAQVIAPDLAEAHRAYGVLEGKAIAIGLDRTSQIALDALSAEVMATAAIEGERLSLDVVELSVKRRLGLATLEPTDHRVDGLVEVVSEAATAFDLPLDEDRLCRWQAALFPSGTSGIRRIAVGRYRDHDEPMQIVSGSPGREVVHYEAPPSKDIPALMQRFLAWFAESSPARVSASPTGSTPIDGFVRAAIAHLWFESIHPFEDGNGRIGRAIVDLVKAQHLRQPVRLYSFSQQLLTSRSAYYDALNQAQRGDTDLTAWVQWFVRQCTAACSAASQTVDQTIQRRLFWEQHAGNGLHDRQRKVLQRLLDDGDGGFLGGLNAEKYMKMTGASKATATRDLSEMVMGGQLWSRGIGKAVRYYINVPGWSHGVDMEPHLSRSDTDAVPVVIDEEHESRRSELTVRVALNAGGYTVSEKSGERDCQYVGPVVAMSTLHIAQDIGRRQAVIHDIRLLDRAPVMGEWLDVKFKGRCGTVTDIDKTCKERGN